MSIRSRLPAARAASTTTYRSEHGFRARLSLAAAGLLAALAWGLPAAPASAEGLLTKLCRGVFGAESSRCGGGEAGEDVIKASDSPQAVLDPSCPDETVFDGLPTEEVYAEGQDCLISGRPEAALLRFEYAWKQGHADSADRIGDMYDSAKWDPSRSPFSKPNQTVADMWYERADQLRRKNAVE